MEHIEITVEKHKSKFKNFIISSLVLSLLINLLRSDYNFAIMAFAYYTWECCYDLNYFYVFKQKLFIFYTWLFSLLYDIIVTFYWKNIMVEKLNFNSNYEKVLFDIVFWLSCKNIIVKVYFYLDYFNYHVYFYRKRKIRSKSSVFK